jgi:hypothetical protein
MSALSGDDYSRECLILPATRVLVLGSRCLDLGTVGEGQGRLTAEMGQFVGRGMTWGRETQ